MPLSAWSMLMRKKYFTGMIKPIASIQAYIDSCGKEKPQNENESIPSSVQSMEPRRKLGTTHITNSAQPWLASTNRNIAQSMCEGAPFSGKP